MAEDHAEGAIIGPTFGRIIGDQFTALRDGDRYYFENQNFDRQTLNEIKDTTLSDLIHGKTSLSPEMALRIEKAFDVSMDVLLRMQAWYDSYTMRQRAGTIEVQRYKPA